MSSSVQQLAATITGLQKQVRAISTTPQLAYSSIEDGGSIDSNHDDGRTMAQFGGQFDGSFMGASLVGPTPPTPSAPIVTAAIGGLTVRWDGLFTDADFAPMDFTRVEVHVSTDPAFVPDTAATLVATIESPRGALPFIARAPGAYYVAFVARSQSGTAGPKSVTSEAVTVALIANAALASPVRGDIASASTTNFATTASDVNVVTASIPVPAGFTQALVMANVVAGVFNSNAVYEYLYLSVEIAGVTTRDTVGGSDPGHFASTTTSKAIRLTGLSGGSISLALSLRTDSAIAANATNRAYLEASAVFLR